MTESEALLAEPALQVPRGPFNVHPIFVREAKGAVVTDVEGKRYIDFAGGICAVNLGHGPDEVLQAVRDQLERYIHTCFHVAMYEPYVRLAGRLNEITPGRFPKKTLLVNSGAEAVENAVKVARHATGRPGVIAFEERLSRPDVPGDDLTSKTMPYKVGFGPYAPEVYRMPYAYCYRCVFHLKYPPCDLACAYHLKTFFQSHVPADQVACLVVEPVLGEGGFVVPPMEYLSVLRQICAEEGIVFIADEVQTGFGRTGEMFACEAFAVEPDLMILGKSLAAGFPLSAVIGKAELMDHPQVGGLGGTYGGNPVACPAALRVLDLFVEKDVRTRARAIGARVLEKFREIQDRCPWWEM